MRSLLFVTAFAFAAPLAGGCAGWGVSVAEPVGYVEIDSAPVADIDVYPQTVYEGRTVYLYNDRWYYREGSRWRYYRQEPAPLVQHHQRFRNQPPRHPEQREQPRGPQYQQHGPQQQQHDEHGHGQGH